MHWSRWVVVVLVVFGAGWMLFDGLHALTTGDYVTPSSGEYAGQLGPWAGLVEAVGIEPRSTFMMLVFVVTGAGWLGLLVAYLRNVPWAWKAMLGAAAWSLWYLPWGTLSAVVQIGLLLGPAGRRATPRPATP